MDEDEDLDLDLGPFGMELPSSERPLRETIERGTEAAIKAADQTETIIDLLETGTGATDPLAAMMELLLVIEAKQDRMLALLQLAPPSSVP